MPISGEAWCAPPAYWLNSGGFNKVPHLDSLFRADTHALDDHGPFGKEKDGRRCFLTATTLMIPQEDAEGGAMLRYEELDSYSTSIFRKTTGSLTSWVKYWRINLLRDKPVNQRPF